MTPTELKTITDAMTVLGDLGRRGEYPVERCDAAIIAIGRVLDRGGIVCDEAEKRAANLRHAEVATQP